MSETLGKALKRTAVDRHNRVITVVPYQALVCLVCWLRLELEPKRHNQTLTGESSLSLVVR